MKYLWEDSGAVFREQNWNKLLVRDDTKRKRRGVSESQHAHVIVGPPLPDTCMHFFYLLRLQADLNIFLWCAQAALEKDLGSWANRMFVH